MKNGSHVKVTRCTILSFPANAGRKTVKVHSKGGCAGGLVGIAINSKVLNSTVDGVSVEGYNAAGVVCEAINSEIEDVSVRDTSVSAENVPGPVAAILKNSTIKGTEVSGT